MKTKLLLSFCVLWFTYQSFGQTKPITPNAEISVLTIAPGTSLNDAFGHSGFRIKDSANNLDIVYGYVVMNSPSLGVNI